MPDTRTTPGATTPRTVQEDAPVSTPTTTAPPMPQARTWVYWFAYAAPGGYLGNIQITAGARLTHMEHLNDVRASIAQTSGKPDVVITSWTLMRVEDADGQVIG